MSDKIFLNEREVKIVHEYRQSLLNGDYVACHKLLKDAGQSNEMLERALTFLGSDL